MTQNAVLIEKFVNRGDLPAFPIPGTMVGPGGRIFDTTVLGPMSMGARSSIGPGVVMGKYSGINSDSFVARATIGAFCAFGSRVSVNPLNHPIDWLSIHEFQYYEHAF